SNRFLFSRGGLREELEKKYAFEDIEIKQFADVLGINIVEKPSQLIWGTDGDKYIIGLQGKVIRKNTDDGLILPVFVDLNNVPVDIHSEVLTQDEVINIFEFNKLLLEQNIIVTKTMIDRLAGKWMAAQTDAGYKILFDATGDIKNQIENLIILLRDTIPDPRGLEYIDLRFGDHVYYK
ncbi:MAG: hypothetical protein ABIH21_00860, partial [Patescibacteria group bacterium]